MKIQFCDGDFFDLDLAKVSAWLVEIGKPFACDEGEIACESGISAEAVRENPKVREFLSNWNRSLVKKPFRTPLSDWREVPFIVDAMERPMRAANSWFRFLWKRRSPKTVRTYAYGLFDFFQYLEAVETLWDKVSDETLVAYRRCQELSESSHKRRHNGTRHLERNTIQLRIMIVAKFYKHAANHYYIAQNPISFDLVKTHRPHDSDFLAHLVKPEREIPVAAYRYSSRPRAAKALPHETVWAWITSMTNDRDRLIAELMYQTGMRREEIIVLRAIDIPKEPNDRVDGGWVEFEIIGKGRRKRLIQISPRSFVRLRYWLDVTRPRTMRRCGISDGEDHGFLWIASRDGHPLQAKTLNQIFADASKKCGIDVNPHLLRHSCAMETRKELYADGIPNPEKALQLKLGHSSIVTTKLIYGDISPEDEAREADTTASLLRRLESDD